MKLYTVAPIMQPTPPKAHSELGTGTKTAHSSICKNWNGPFQSPLLLIDDMDHPTYWPFPLLPKWLRDLLDLGSGFLKPVSTKEFSLVQRCFILVSSRSTLDVLIYSPTVHPTTLLAISTLIDISAAFVAATRSHVFASITHVTTWAFKLLRIQLA